MVIKPGDTVKVWLRPMFDRPCVVTVISERGPNGEYVVSHDLSDSNAWMIFHESCVEPMKNLSDRY